MKEEKIVQINDDYGYGSDSYNFILYKKSIVNDPDSDNYGKSVWSQKGFYSSLRMLIKKLLGVVVREDIDDLIKVNEKIDEIDHWVQEKLSDAKN